MLAASWLHLGFQLAVTVAVYPTLAAVPPERWPGAHAAHSRRITPVVVLVYAVVVVGAGTVLVAGPRTTLALTAVGANGLALVVTALVAAPAHARLGRGKDDRAVRRLLLADRVRTLAAVVAAGTALAAHSAATGP